MPMIFTVPLFMNLRKTREVYYTYEIRYMEVYNTRIKQDVFNVSYKFKNIKQTSTEANKMYIKHFKLN